MNPPFRIPRGVGAALALHAAVCGVLASVSGRARAHRAAHGPLLAWRRADHHERLRGQWMTARPFYQGVILQHLDAERDRRAKGPRSPYRTYTPAELRAIRLTRLWLEFGEWP